MISYSTYEQIVYLFQPIALILILYVVCKILLKEKDINVEVDSKKLDDNINRLRRNMQILSDRLIDKCHHIQKKKPTGRPKKNEPKNN